MAPEAHGAQVLPDPDYGPKTIICPTKTDHPYNFCFLKFVPSFTVEAVDALQNLFRPPPDSWLRVMARSRRSITAKVCYWERCTTTLV